MQITTTLRLYGKRGLRLETFTLPAMQDDEILARVIADSLRLPSWKEANQGVDRKEVPDDVVTRSIIIGHEFCGEILAVGKKRQHEFQPGQRCVIQANLQLPDQPDCPGYPFPWIGGKATHVVIPNGVVAQDYLLTWEGDTWFEGSLVEPPSYVVGAFDASYHLQEGSYDHVMGIHPQGRTLILDGAGPMGLLATDYALHGPINPSLLVVTNTNKPELSYARRHYPSGPQTLIHYLDDHETNRDTLLTLGGGHGFDNIFVFVPNEQLITLAPSLLAPDDCLDFFADPQNKQFSAPINFYDMHYAFTHYVGTSGGSTGDMHTAVALMQAEKVQTARMATHILDLNVADKTTLSLPAVDGGKKLVYIGKTFPLTPLGEIADPELATIVAHRHGIWSQEAEAYLLTHAEDIAHDQPRYATMYLPGGSPRQLRHPLS